MSDLKECYSSLSNPMGNFLPFDSRSRKPACEINAINTGILPIYQKPVTTSYPDRSKFAKLLHPNTAICRDTGYQCRASINKSYKVEYYTTKLYQELELESNPIQELESKPNQ